MPGKQRSFTKITQITKADSLIREALSLQPVPAIYILEVTNRCDMECTFCLNPKFKPKSQDMTMKLFNKIMRESIKYGAREKIFFTAHKGEPLLNSGIIEMLSLAKKFARKVHLDTNGLSLNPSLSKDIIQTGLDSIAFGLDGACQETYESLRRGSSFKKVVENIKNLVELKNKAKSNIQVIIRVINGVVKRKEISQIKKAWSGIVDTVQETKDDRKIWKNKKIFPCLSPWSIMMINPEGDVYICFMAGDPNRVVGNINKKSIRELWRGSDLNYLRDRHLKNRFENLQLCQNCNYRQSKHSLDFSFL